MITITLFILFKHTCALKTLIHVCYRLTLIETLVFYCTFFRHKKTGAKAPVFKRKLIISEEIIQAAVEPPVDAG